MKRAPIPVKYFAVPNTRIEDAPDDHLKLTWAHGVQQATLRIDLVSYETRIEYFDEGKQAIVELVV